MNRGVLGLVAAASTSVILGIMFLQMCKMMPTCLVYASLLLTPVLLITMGAVLHLMNLTIAGIMFAVFGLIIATCMMWCWRDLIPFTVIVVETIAHVIQLYTAIMGITVFGGILGMVWSILVVLATFGVYAMMFANAKEAEPSSSSEDPHLSQAAGYGIYFLIMLVMYWGSQVCRFVPHVSTCGVFGRWYYNKDLGSPVTSSLGFAMNKGFGPICFGAFVISVIRALQAVAEAMEGNETVEILGMVLKCLLSCVGEIVEFFSDLAYVQVAVRGFSFCEGVNATFALCKFQNIKPLLAGSLIGSVVTMTSLCCMLGAIAAGVAASWPYGTDSNSDPAAFTVCKITAVFSMLVGIIVGGGMMATISSGCSCLMVLYAEDPEALERSRPALAEAFEARMNDIGEGFELASRSH
mmetsp:Transcript_80496/g.176499  ORF Transcript_80496/g.176499 Transcript_80496/m.176499 type:complete len:410 (-) Transcript_80496:379-1608(-)